MSGLGGVLLLHGHGRLGASMMRLGRAARKEGYATFSPNYPYRRSLPEIASWLAPLVSNFERNLEGPLHIITHSLGGLVARALLAAHPAHRLGRVVMLAPPNAGSELADLLFKVRAASWYLGKSGLHLRTVRTATDEASLGTIAYPLGVIAGDRSLAPLPKRLLPRPHDGKVSLAATHVAGMAEHLTLPVTHTLMVYDTRVIEAALSFVRDGVFDSQHSMRR